MNNVRVHCGSLECGQRIDFERLTGGFSVHGFHNLTQPNVTDGVHPELWTNAMLGFPQSEENRGEEESLQRRTDCIDTARSRIEHGDGHGASAWGGRANDLSMAAAVLRHGGIGCPRAEAITR